MTKNDIIGKIVNRSNSVFFSDFHDGMMYLFHTLNRKVYGVLEDYVLLEAHKSILESKADTTY